MRSLISGTWGSRGCRDLYVESYKGHAEAALGGKTQEIDLLEGSSLGLSLFSEGGL